MRLDLMMAQAMCGAPGGADGAGGQGSSFTFLIMMVLMLVIMYLVVYRPQIKQRKKLEAAIAAIKKGDRVLTSGGIYGDVVGTKETILVVEIAKDVKVEINRAMVTSVIPREG